MEAAKQNGAQQQKNPLDRPARDHQELRALLTSPSVIEQIKMTIPQHMKPERLAKILLSATLKTPKLMQCNQLSLLKALGNLSELGLEPGGARPLVHLIPFEVSQGKGPDGNWLPKRADVNIIIDYRGYLELFRRSGYCEDFDLDIVYEGEPFEYAKGFGPGNDRRLIHKPDWKRDRSTLDGALCVYFIAYFKGGAGRHCEVMSIPDVLRIRDRSEGWKSAVSYKKTDKSPWFTDPVRMALKTVIRRAANFIPLSAEARDAMEMENNEFSDPGEIIDQAIRRPQAPATDNAAANWAAASAAQQQPEDAEFTQEEKVDPETGEVTGGPAPQEGAPQSQAEEKEPSDPVGSLLWRIARAATEQLGDLAKQAAQLPKDEPRRLEVSAAIKARREQLAKEGGQQ